MRPFPRNEYWLYSKQHELSLLFITPLWLLYEGSALILNNSWLGGYRTGADFLLKQFLDTLGLHPGLSVMLPGAALGLYFFIRLRKIRQFTARPRFFGMMFLESLGYAIVFGLIVGGITDLILTSVPLELDEQKMAALVISLGSGPYEEFVFRFALILGLLALLRERLHQHRYAAYTITIIVSSLLFASFHYLDVFGELWTWSSFTFRFLAGIALALLFIWRGLGVAAYTHSLYNILLMFR